MDIYGSTFWGVVNPKGTPTITFDNISCTGSQMIHSAKNQTIVIKGNVTTTIVPSYDSPSNGIPIPSTSGYQQAIEMAAGGTLNFADNSTFTGTTYKDDVIDMQGSGVVNIGKNTVVNLNPHSHGLPP
ncbi:hypothetical protein MOO45_03575 [Bombilactobacillus folatiphilus]|uniref:Uncharacterized protein n=1 Tax=Bombilactobacillus folatiphilus TaxID=2923362 RepID=A0ABY4PAN4_9LACO|nr:hypothetical protein [Bombilactobacillus folatiphilus]UQS82733.1 hypothetical protein MOO45_03575 [Bombilactobacillus folatiphilus]